MDEDQLFLLPTRPPRFDERDLTRKRPRVAKYRLEVSEVEAIFTSEDQVDRDDIGSEEEETEYDREVSRLHRREDLRKIHTYRDGILGSRGAYILIPGDGRGFVWRVCDRTPSFDIPQLLAALRLVDFQASVRSICVLGEAAFRRRPCGSSW